MRNVSIYVKAMQYIEESVLESLRDKEMGDFRTLEFRDTAFKLVSHLNTKDTKTFFDFQAWQKEFVPVTGLKKARTNKDIVDNYSTQLLASFLNEEWRSNHPGFMAKIA